MNILKSKNEYLIQLKDNPKRELIVLTKAFKDPKGVVIKYTAILPLLNDTVIEFTPEELVSSIEPFTATEFFTMYTQLMNIANPSRISYDWDFACILRQKILQSIKERGIVQHGTGKFEQFDYKRLNNIKHKLQTHDIRLCKQCSKITDHVVFHYTKVKISVECRECS